MSARSTVRAFPTLLRTGFAEAVAYRAELVVWVLATTMPLVMMALWSAVAREAPVGRYGQSEFVSYFLATFIVRQLTGCWIFWEMNFELRNGTLAMRLLRPIQPLVAYTAESLAAMPMRMLVSLPVAVVSLAVVGSRGVTHDPAAWGLFLVAISGAWLLTLLVNFIVGCGAFFFESSLKIMDAWLIFFFVLSGYLIPTELFPPQAKAIINWLPFRYQIGFPVEVMTGALLPRDALPFLACQWAWVLAALGLTWILWNRGLRRFAAYGG